jgi:hypothetical protein
MHNSARSRIGLQGRGDGWESGARGQRSEVRGQRPEVRSRESEKSELLKANGLPPFPPRSLVQNLHHHFASIRVHSRLKECCELHATQLAQRREHGDASKKRLKQPEGSPKRTSSRVSRLHAPCSFSRLAFASFHSAMPVSPAACIPNFANAQAAFLPPRFRERIDASRETRAKRA